MMENNKPEKKLKNTELILMIFVLLSMGLIIFEIFQNIISHILGN